ncbi:hypothetical protein [Candidatus Similichlamydia laticola]|uniref:hypothetical protein n=1 Tax=Candidatus Similichlamydia laticola TaxID=2170265 RepID=UPI0011C03BD0|nr:hypothetical protein [Candidatus Similichlamydia laticola]
MARSVSCITQSPYSVRSLCVLCRGICCFLFNVARLVAAFLARVKGRRNLILERDFSADPLIGPQGECPASLVAVFTSLGLLFCTFRIPVFIPFLLFILVLIFSLADLIRAFLLTELSRLWNKRLNCQQESLLCQLFHEHLALSKNDVILSLRVFSLLFVMQLINWSVLLFFGISFLLSYKKEFLVKGLLIWILQVFFLKTFGLVCGSIMRFREVMVVFSRDIGTPNPSYQACLDFFKFHLIELAKAREIHRSYMVRFNRLRSKVSELKQYMDQLAFVQSIGIVDIEGYECFRLRQIRLLLFLWQRLSVSVVLLEKEIVAIQGSLILGPVQELERDKLKLACYCSELAKVVVRLEAIGTHIFQDAVFCFGSIRIVFPSFISDVIWDHVVQLFINLN